MSTNKLILTIGIPRCGKTTWIKEYVKEHPNTVVVSPDDVRLSLHGKRYELLAEPMIWSIVKIMVRSLFLSGNTNIIIDATHTSKKRRTFWNDLNENMYYKLFKPNKDVCIERAVRTGQSDLVKIIEAMYKRFELPKEDEKMIDIDSI